MLGAGENATAGIGSCGEKWRALTKVGSEFTVDGRYIQKLVNESGEDTGFLRTAGHSKLSGDAVRRLSGL